MRLDPFAPLTAEAKSMGGNIGTDWGEAISGLALALLFCAFGLGATWVLGHTIYEAQRARDWVPAKATVNAFGDLTVAYQYEFGGAWHGGNRLGIFPFAVKGNVDTWDAEMNAKIASAYAGRTPITVWVNPRNPSESMVNRDSRWIVLVAFLPFVFGFGGIGLAVLWVTLRRISGTPEYGHDERSPAVIWVIALVLNSGLVPVAIFFFHDALSKRSLEAATYGVGTLLVGVGAIRAAMAASARMRERGPSDPAEVRARLVRQRQAMARLARRELKEDFPVFLVFMGIVAAVLVGIWLVMRSMGPGHG